MILGEDAHVTITVATALAVLGGVWRFSARLSEIQVKTDTLWQFLFRRGQVEGLAAGGLQKNSPVALTDVGAGWFAGGLGADLKAWYQKAGGVKLTDKALAAEIERWFGDRITDEVCIPNVITQGACLAAAVLVCRSADAE